jgi:hypothetical protein
MTALSLGDEHPPLAEPQDSKPQASTSQGRRPPGTMAATIARSRCVRCAAVSSSTSPRPRNLREKLSCCCAFVCRWAGRIEASA